MTTVPYSGAAGQLSYRRELNGGLAERPNYFVARTRAIELNLLAEHHAAQKRIDEAHFVAQNASSSAWTTQMRSIHFDAHARIDADRAERMTAPKPVYVPSYSPCNDGPPAPVSYMR
ncbi:hypothetical protein DIPPA_02210 [Diplonema papillatum]|nr:hypothetical protein DIPPA_02210 [Diplonema papillatum]